MFYFFTISYLKKIDVARKYSLERICVCYPKLLQRADKYQHYLRDIGLFAHRPIDQIMKSNNAQNISINQNCQLTLKKEDKVCAHLTHFQTWLQSPIRQKYRDRVYHHKGCYLFVKQCNIFLVL